MRMRHKGEKANKARQRGRRKQDKAKGEKGEEKERGQSESVGEEILVEERKVKGKKNK